MTPLLHGLSFFGGVLFTASAVGILVSVVRSGSGRGVPLTTAMLVCLGSVCFGAFAWLLEPFSVFLFVSYVLTFVCWAPTIIFRG